MFSTTQIRALVARFRLAESGAATVDFVVGTALALGLTLSVMNAISKGVENLASDIEEDLTEMGVPDFTATFGLNTGQNN